MPPRSRKDIPALNALESAAAARREARNRLRKETGAVAVAILDALRVGDHVVVEVGGDAATYVVEKVTWRAWRTPFHGDPDDATVVWTGSYSETLSRLSDSSEPFALVDCRFSYTDHDEEASYKPAGRDVFLLGVENAAEDNVDAFRRHLATDEDLALFAEEAAQVAEEFALLLAGQARLLNSTVDEMLDTAAER